MGITNTYCGDKRKPRHGRLHNSETGHSIHYFALPEDNSVMYGTSEAPGQWQFITKTEEELNINPEEFEKVYEDIQKLRKAEDSLERDRQRLEDQILGLVK